VGRGRAPARGAPRSGVGGGPLPRPRCGDLSSGRVSDPSSSEAASR
jgi:hypothetical protein